MSMLKCKECGQEVSSSAKKCPHCGKRLSYTGLYIFIGILVFIILVFVFPSVYINSNTTNTAISSSQERFTLLEGTTGYYDGTYSYYVEGSIKNNTDKKYSYIQVTFILYDKDGNQLGTAFANANDIEPQATWKFKAADLSSYGSQVATYKLSEITGW